MRFFLGDDNGQLKSVNCFKKPPTGDWKIETTLLDDGGKAGKTKAVQRLVVKREKIALTRSDGTATLFIPGEISGSVQIAQEWVETRFRPEHRYIGLDIMECGNVISCTSAGHLRLQFSEKEHGNDMEMSSETFIPNRLAELVVSDDGGCFAYGGDEVEVSVWDTNRAFDSSRRLLPTTILERKRRKDHLELMEGEVWRAKNVSNDFLNLRQPVHNTTLTFLSPVLRGNGSTHHILAGTKMGSVRRYDTRAARRPVADWRDIGKVGGIRKVQHGNFEYEAFVADHGGNLLALDLRTGRALYAYSGIAGAISSLVPTSPSLSPPLLASTSLDRFFRLHSANKPPKTSGDSVDKKGEVLAKLWIKSAAGCVAWDGVILEDSTRVPWVDEEDEVWTGMQDVDDKGERSSAELEHAQKSKKQKPR